MKPKHSLIFSFIATVLFTLVTYVYWQDSELNRVFFLPIIALIVFIIIVIKETNFKHQKI